MPQAPADLEAFEANANTVASMLRAISNERRLMILCKLAEWGEANAGTLADAVGLSQSALSQHLARMRAEGIVTYRRDAQTLFYRVADPRIGHLLGALQAIYCATPPPRRAARPRPRKRHP